VRKVLAWATGSLVALFVAIMAVQIVASERVEVVELHTRTAGGEFETTRLWVVDHDDAAWLRAGQGEGSGWYMRLTANPRVRLTRGGETADYIAVPYPEQRQMINDRMREKYTWGDEVISLLFGSRNGAIAIRLTPVNADTPA